MQIPLASHRYVIKIHIPEYKLIKMTGRVLFFLLKVIALYFITTGLSIINITIRLPFWGSKCFHIVSLFISED